LLAVARQHTGRAVAQNVVRLCLENGVQKGYRTAVTEATGLVSQHIFRETHGFVARHEIAYQTFRYQGRRPFASIKEHRSVILMDKSVQG
jgi:predicted N-acetyltransferase YhbS